MKIDIIEGNARSLDEKILKILLIDRSTNTNIKWATSEYIVNGNYYLPENEITIDLITGFYSLLLRPRAMKTKELQSIRTRDRAEVFTPLWICNQQNNLIDEQWFGRPDVFNKTIGTEWTTTTENITFENQKGRMWQDYVKANRLEITCGEAPYLVSRYDTITGKPINSVHDRIGLLDRKLRIVNENTNNETDWFKWAKKAYQSTYGYEYQGDNLLIARLNLLFTFSDNIIYKFNRQPSLNELKQIAYIISWNLWQMDGLKYTAPYSERIQEEKFRQLSLFDDEDYYKNLQRESVLCVIRDWKSKCYVKYYDLMKGGK